MRLSVDVHCTPTTKATLTHYPPISEFNEFCCIRIEGESSSPSISLFLHGDCKAEAEALVWTLNNALQKSRA